jgi:hypothetical protein
MAFASSCVNLHNYIDELRNVVVFAISGKESLILPLPSSPPLNKAIW